METCSTFVEVCELMDKVVRNYITDIARHLKMHKLRKLFKQSSSSVKINRAIEMTLV